jgi:hypothetical protein
MLRRFARLRMLALRDHRPLRRIDSVDLSSLSSGQIGVSIAGVVVVVVLAFILWRILKKAIGGCISTGIGCLVLAIGLIAVVLYFLSRADVTSLDDILNLVGL